MKSSQRVLSALILLFGAACSSESFRAADDGGGATDGGAGDGALPGDGGATSDSEAGSPPGGCTGSTHAICIDFEDGVFPPAGFTPVQRFGEVSLDSTIGNQSARSMKATSPVSDAGAARAAMIVHTEPVVHSKVTLGADFRVDQVFSGGDTDLLTVEYVDAADATLVSFDLTIHTGQLFFERGNYGTYLQSLGYTPQPNVWFHLEFTIDVSTLDAPHAVVVTPNGSTTIGPVGSAFPAPDGTAVSVGLDYVDSALPAVGLHVDNVTVDYP